MSSNPSWLSSQCFFNLTGKKKVTGITCRNRLITLSIQGHPLWETKESRGRRGETRRILSLFISNDFQLFHSKERGVIHLCLLAYSGKKQPQKRKKGCHHSWLILEDITYKRLTMTPVKWVVSLWCRTMQTVSLLPGYQTPLLAFSRQASLTEWRADFSAISFWKAEMPCRQLLLNHHWFHCKRMQTVARFSRHLRHKLA